MVWEFVFHPALVSSLEHTNLWFDLGAAPGVVWEFGLHPALASSSVSIHSWFDRGTAPGVVWEVGLHPALASSSVSINLHWLGVISSVLVQTLVASWNNSDM